MPSKVTLQSKLKEQKKMSPSLTELILQDGGSVSGPVTITYNPNTGASFTTEGLDTNADFEDVELLSFVGDDAFNFGISARVGGANQDLFIDNFVLSLGTLSAIPNH